MGESMKSMVRVLRWLLSGLLIAGSLGTVLAQVVYQVNGSGNDGSSITGSLGLNQVASTQASFNINNTDRAKFNLKGMLTVAPGVSPPPTAAPPTFPAVPVTQPSPPIGNIPGAGIKFTTITDKYQTLEPVCVNV